MSISRVKAAGAIVAVILLLVTGNVAGNEPVSIDGRILTLSQCIDLGLKTNPAGAISLQGLKAAREKIEEGRSGYYPSFKLSSGYTYTTPQDSMPQVSEDSYDTRLALRQTLFDAGATANLLKGIRHGVSVQEHEVSKTELDIAYNIRLTFIDTLKKQALLEVEKKARESSERHLAQAQALHQAGVSSRADVIKSEVQLSNARLNVVRAENAVLSAKAALSAFMGVEVTVQFALDGREVDSLPQAGLGLLTLTDGAFHESYYLGEFPLSTCRVELVLPDGRRAEGGAQVMADDAELARSLAILDATLASRLPGWEQVSTHVESGAFQRSEENRRRCAMLAATRVDFALLGNNEEDGDED